ncbi:nitrilase-related carbon-nitrogen hydrolase [Cellulomonas bogoriensis]|uniref:Hydrolase n=1 Tax=Cellulomonas bogoriensis 69B4 = DSM 16987 TaxID=1386082 RepID=A0A0A0BSS7_9CELL|nr:nitrilase-related carbon-nitrogen hydrolase [Cellulomonas bogoriensis]KGM10980.1 hydrolase [Cellulomonas bogoriensis 69B4 = DSM 16987]
MTLRVRAVPMASGRDRALNLSVVLAEIAAAATAGVRLLVLPEYATAFDPRGVDADLAEGVDGPVVAEVREASARAGVAVVLGTVVPGARAGRAANVVVVVDGGRVVGEYRKVHLYDAFGHRESERLDAGAPGAAPVVVEVDGMHVGVMTCYDLRFPESARRLVDAGATVLVVPAAWAAGPGKADQWDVLLRARAVEDVSYVVAAAQTGRGVVGDSQVVDARGVVLGRGSADAVDVELDPAHVQEQRRLNPSLQNRRYRVVPAP